MSLELQPFDISKLADNGLRRGRTTGTCAAAAAKAGALLLEHEELVSEVTIALPDQTHSLRVPIKAVEKIDEQTVRAEVIKEAGDDPDATDGATIFCLMRRNEVSDIRFFAGEGVGTVTEAGIRVPVGEPAINPVPRQMIAQAIVDAVGSDQGFDVTIGCENGAEIAKKTFNPRLGIKGGISILGTTGIVEPMSLAAYVASIEVYLNVALAEQADSVAILPGNIGLGFAGKKLHLPKKRIVHISNFLGFSLEHIAKTLASEQALLPQLWVLGHPGKLAKVLDGHWDTHSKASGMAMNALAKFAADHGYSNGLSQSIAEANTVEEAIHIVNGTADAQGFWQQLETRLAEVMQTKAGNVQQLRVKLFDMRANELKQENAP